MTMTFKSVKLVLGAALIAGGVSFTAPSIAQDAEAAPLTLDDLLDRVKRGRVMENRENKEREARFKRERDNQVALLKEAQAEVAREEKRSDALEKKFNENDIRIGDKEQQLADRMGEFGELFGVVRTVAGDTESAINSSLISSQYPGRTAFLRELAARKELPRIEELEQLWASLHEQMTLQGQNVRYTATILTPDGEPSTGEAVRIGPFVAIAEGKYLRYIEAGSQLAELGRQPGSRYVSAAAEVEEAEEGTIVPAAIDPSRGAILSLLVQAPSLSERISFGGTIGYIIIGIAIIGILMALERIIVLSLVGAKVSSQMKKTDQPDSKNPLGRVLQAYKDNEAVDVETLELKLDEAVLKETPKLEARLATLKTLAAVAPLLGLLGTVTGMIETFQAITLFGTGDPKLMAGGISQALITTVLGLVAAIPIILLHSLANARSRGVVAVLEEQSAGMIARHAEDHPHHGPQG